MLEARKRWSLRDVSDDLVAELQHDCQVSRLTARLLALRGINDAARAQDFLNKRLADLHRPEGLLGMDAAAQRLGKAINKRQRILVHGDFDVDGSTAASLIKLFCQACSWDADVWIPHRVDDGYGLSASSLAAVSERDSDLLITVDCGIADQGWAERIEQECDCDVIVTDHHLPQDQLPRCTAVVNPNQPGCDYPDKGLAGVGVAWKLCWATACVLCGGEKLTDDLRQFMLDSLALVAIGTVADCAPLDHENRILVHHGLQALAKTSNPGLRALLEHCRINEVPTADDIGWRIGPLLNASGRLSSALRNVDLLCGTDEALIAGLLKEVVDENDERRRLSQILTEDLINEVSSHPSYVDRSALVFAGDGWHPGVVGIVASRLVERFARPACVIAIEDGEGRGSLRTLPGLHLGEALAACEPHIISGGGHASAAGLRIREDQVADFTEAFDRYVKGQFPTGIDSPCIDVDANVSITDLDGGFFDELRSLAPFGIANPEPVLQLDACSFVSRPTLFGRKGEHVRGAITDPGGGMRQILAWKASDNFTTFSQPGTRFRFLVRPEASKWRGEWTSRLVLVDGCLS